MNHNLKIVLSTLAGVGIAAYIIWSVSMGRRNRSDVKVVKIDILVADSADVDIVRPEMAGKWILDAGLWPVGMGIDEIDTRAVSDCVESHDFVRSAKTFVSLDGTLSVSITQRKPIVRFITDRGYNFYITDDLHVVPVSNRSAHYVPVVTGNFGLPFDTNFSGKLASSDGEEKKEDENYIFPCKLINFVNHIGKSEFWSSQIVQINVTEAPYTRNRNKTPREPELELVPRVGDHIILLGRLEAYEEKLDKLMRFYNNGLNREGWNKWNHINLKYSNQIVCSRK